MPFGHLQATAIDMQPGLAGGHDVGPHWAAGLDEPKGILGV